MRHDTRSHTSKFYLCICVDFIFLVILCLIYNTLHPSVLLIGMVWILPEATTGKNRNRDRGEDCDKVLHWTEPARNDSIRGAIR